MQPSQRELGTVTANNRYAGNDRFPFGSTVNGHSPRQPPAQPSLPNYYDPHEPMPGRRNAFEILRPHHIDLRSLAAAFADDNFVPRLPRRNASERAAAGEPVTPDEARERFEYDTDILPAAPDDDLLYPPGRLAQQNCDQFRREFQSYSRRC